MSSTLPTMGEVDKPFGCTQPGCGMSFTNEDHLTVHRRRHEMQLSVSGGEHHTPSLVKHHGFIIDQTPTPTRFLRQCEEVGLFQEISLNPFDEQFRRASLLRSHHSVTETLNGSGSGGGDGESLDTPRVLPPVDSDQTISSTSRDDLGAPPPPSTTTSRTHTGTGVDEVVSGVAEEEGDATPGRLSLNVASAAEAAQQHTSSVISTPTPVITAGPSVTQSLGLVDMSGSGKVSISQSLSPAPQLPTNATLCAAASGSTSVPPSPSATVLQLLLRLPNGQAIPVEIPATPVVSSSPAAPNSSSITTSASPITLTNESCTLPQPSLAKMRLKQALSSNSTAARPGGSARASRAHTADRIAEMTRSRNFSGTSSTEGEGEEDSSLGINAGMKTGERKRRHSSDNEDPVEKRKKFLERNRAAAIRCREKKKKWIENLSIKYDELGCINQKLQSEVSSLRSEVATLKTMLLQHKDCPVTLAMQGDGSLDSMNTGYDLGPTSQAPAITLPLVPPSLQQLSPITTTTTHYQPSPINLHHLHHSSNNKPRTRSLSLPSIATSSSTSKIEPLPVNLTSSSSSSSSLSSSSCYVPLLQPVTNSGVVTSVSLSTKTATLPVSQPATSYLSHHHLPVPPSSTSTVFKISGPSHHPQPTSSTQLVSHSPLGKVTVMGPTDSGLPKTVVLSGAPNVIVATPSHGSPSHLLNLTLQPAPTQTANSVSRKPHRVP
ncbi:hypothetical protein Pcinc_037664 [Petrolisthes cinctipes]|uniref:Cyclic AMP-dependent transcription factor ATF-7 n=1 Tax=Petrolisthes cinctipes TaxID=88211 RepID=A0AAE1BVA8_PETCI|nr:hypothetical protein Pcinc_037664 [Petrolisthes cinctipes]